MTRMGAGWPCSDDWLTPPHWTFCSVQTYKQKKPLHPLKTSRKKQPSRLPTTRKPHVSPYTSLSSRNAPGSICERFNPPPLPTSLLCNLSPTSHLSALVTLREDPASSSLLFQPECAERKAEREPTRENANRSAAVT